MKTWDNRIERSVAEFGRHGDRFKKFKGRRRRRVFLFEKRHLGFVTEGGARKMKRWIWPVCAGMLCILVGVAEYYSGRNRTGEAEGPARQSVSNSVGEQEEKAQPGFRLLAPVPEQNDAEGLLSIARDPGR